ncbi:AmmeMemoRadiSam system protein B [Candidatus Margulisiibacteriota bacterium]
MKNNIVYGAIMPHPPILVPFIGRDNINAAKKSQSSLIGVAKKLKKISHGLDAIVLISPHGSVAQSTVPVYTAEEYFGSFHQFGFPEPEFRAAGDPEFSKELVKEAGNLASATDITTLDHGMLVPLYYPLEEKVELPIVPIAIGFLGLNELFNFGKKIQITANRLNKKVAVIASADMSHKLIPTAPSGYDPAGQEFDNKLVELVRNYDINGILNFDPLLADRAGQDALWSIAILLGALDQLPIKHNVLSYEGPFGVGYMVADFEVENGK